MKNIFKLFSLMLVAGTVMVSCDKPNNNPTHQTPKYTITVNANNAAYGTVTGGGVYDSAATATLTATANEGYKFVNWADGNANNPRIVTVTSNATYTATFEELAGVNVTFGDMNWTAQYVNCVIANQAPGAIMVAAAQTDSPSQMPIVQMLHYFDGAPATGTYTGNVGFSQGVTMEGVQLWYFESTGLTLQYQDAEREYDEALGILEELTSQKTDAFQPYMAIVMNNLGNLLREQQKYNEAKEKYKKALDIRRQLAERNPDAYRPYLARTLNNLANLHRDTKYYNEAKDEYFESLSISPSDPDKAITWNNIATLYRILEEYDSALDAYQNTLGYYQTLAKQYPNPFRPFLARTLRIMALLYRNLGDIANAETMEQECLTIYKNMKKINSEAFYEDVDDVMQLFNNTKPLT